MNVDSSSPGLMTVRVYDIGSEIGLQTKFHVVILALHSINILFIECGAMCVCWTKPLENIAIMQCGMMDRFHFQELV